jgi:hypothetical protein
MKEKHVIQHGVTQAQAKQAIETAINVYSRKFPQYQPKTRWPSDSQAQVTFNVKGMTLTATINIHPRTIESEMQVPFIFLPFRGRALKVIEDEIRKWVARAKAGEIRT